MCFFSNNLRNIKILNWFWKISILKPFNLEISFGFVTFFIACPIQLDDLFEALAETSVKKMF